MGERGGHIKWPAEAIWEAVVPLLPGFTVEVLPQVDSTNSELMRRARDGLTEPVLLVAEAQTAGRGRLGRSWASQPGDSLTFSLGLPLAPADWSGLSLLVGVSVAQSLHPQLQLKWPNDVWLQDRKLGGILIETATTTATAPGPAGPGRQVVIGVGLNLAPREGAGLSTPPAWVQELEPGLDAPGALLRIIEPLVRKLLVFEAKGFAPFRQAYQALDVLADRPVVLSDGTQGIARGVDERGALLVHTSQGLRTVSSAEVSVRPTSST